MLLGESWRWTYTGGDTCTPRRWTYHGRKQCSIATHLCVSQACVPIAMCHHHTRMSRGSRNNQACRTRTDELSQRMDEGKQSQDASNCDMYKPHSVRELTHCSNTSNETSPSHLCSHACLPSACEPYACCKLKLRAMHVAPALVLMLAIVLAHLMTHAYAPRAYVNACRRFTRVRAILTRKRTHTAMQMHAASQHSKHAHALTHGSAHATCMLATSQHSKHNL